MLFLRNLFGISYSVIALAFWYLFSYFIFIRDRTFLSLIDGNVKQIYLDLYVLNKTEFFFAQMVVFILVYLTTCASIYLVNLGRTYANTVDACVGNRYSSVKPDTTLTNSFIINNDEFFCYQFPKISKIISYVIIVLLVSQAVSGTGLVFITTSLLLVSSVNIFLAFAFSVFKHFKYYCKLKVYYYENQLRDQKQNQV
jgi:hypothetical protein